MTRFAVIQIDCVPGDEEANAETASGLIGDAARDGASVVVLPELADVGYDLSLVPDVATSLSQNRFLTTVMALAKEHGIVAITGIAERVEDGRIFNSVVATDGPGSVLARYRKSHLFSPTGETDVFVVGCESTTACLFGIKCGISVCFDLRFPNMYRLQALRGVEAFVVVSAFPFPRLRHWMTLLAARAIENQAYVVAANRVGEDAGISFCGSSGIWDPFGVCLGGLDEVQDGFVSANIDVGRVHKVRSDIPVLAAENAAIDAEFGPDGGLEKMKGSV